MMYNRHIRNTLWYGEASGLEVIVSPQMQLQRFQGAELQRLAARSQ